MAHSYPIWNNVTACNYSSSKSWGSKNCMSLDQYVGSSAKNSEMLASIRTTKRELVLEDGREVVSFALFVDSIMLKQAWFENDNGRAGKLLNIDSFLPLTVDNM